MSAYSGHLERLASPAFVGALALLIVNDVALKPLYHNAVTGKLSDFAGLFALALFAATVAPRHARLAGVLIAAAFALWKTRYAQPLIESLNAVSPMPFGRTVDLTDLAALPMVPLAVWLAPRLSPWPLPRLLQLGLVAVALTAFTASQRARYVARATIDVPVTAAVDEAALQAAFDEIVKERGLRCEVCVPLSERRVYVPQQDDRVRALIVELAGPTLHFTATGYDRRRGVHTLTRVLRRDVTRRFPGVAVVDTTTDSFAITGGETTIFAVRPEAAAVTAEAARGTIEAIVREVASAHGLVSDESARLHYTGLYSGLRPAEQDLVVRAVLDANGLVVVRIVRRTSRFAALHAELTADLAARLERQLGPESVTRHAPAPVPPEWLY